MSEAGALAPTSARASAQAEVVLRIDKRLSVLEPVGGMSEAEYAAWDSAINAARAALASPPPEGQEPAIDPAFDAAMDEVYG